MFGHPLCTLEEKSLPILNSVPTTGKSNILSKIYLDSLLESDEMHFYMREFGGLKKNPTQEKYKNMPKSKLLELYEEVKNKTSKLSKRERDLVTYYAIK